MVILSLSLSVSLFLSHHIPRAQCENHTDACINEDLYYRMADALANFGYKNAGYEYGLLVVKAGCYSSLTSFVSRFRFSNLCFGLWPVNIDDCWPGPRGPQGELTADPKRFPSGIKALADYVHAKGLKLGALRE